jgi:predicted metal-binding membrane protein
MRLSVTTDTVRPPAIGPIWLLIAGSWAVAIGAQFTGSAVLLHHHTLIEHGPPLWAATILFLAGWQVMIAAMMLPASVPTFRAIRTFLGTASWLNRGQLAFLAAFALVWSAFGLFAFLGDVVVHHVVDVTPWLARRPWIIEAGVLALAGAYQLGPVKSLSLAACRHPATLFRAGSTSTGTMARLGVEHGLWCLGSSGALMLLMFAEGFGNLWWMAALTGLMVYEVLGRRGVLAARISGVALLTLALVLVVSGGMA